MLNKIILQGRFAADIELRSTKSGTSVASATIAVQRSRKDQSGDYPTDWVEVVFWGKTAEFAAQYFRKGDTALVTGRLESRKWEDKNGGKRVSWEVQAESLDFCGKKDKAESDFATDNPDLIGMDEPPF